MKKKMLAVLLTATMALSMTACGSSQTTETTTAAAETTAASVEQATTAAAETTAAAAEVTYQEDVVVGMSTSVTAIDIHETATTGIFYLVEMTHDKLMTVDSLTHEFSPALASEWEWISDTELKLKLREDAVFHNGEKFTADDVVFTFDRIKAHEGSTAATKAAALDSIEVVNDYEIIMKLKEVNVDWLDILAYNTCIIMNREAVEADNVNGPACGTGPWVLNEYVANDYTTVKVNENYWGEVPTAKNLKLTYIPEDASRLVALETGEIDVAMNISDTDIEYVKNNENLEYVGISVGTCNYLAFDSSEAPGDNQDLRLAFAYGLDKQEIIDIAKMGLGEVAVSNWGKYTYGLDADMEDYGYNPEKAKEHLAASGISEITISCRSNFADVATVIQDQMSEIGLTVNINEVEAAALTAMSKYAVHEHEAMLYNYGWGVFGDDCRSPFYKDSNVNKARIYNEEIMELVDSAKEEFDETKRIEMYHKIQAINHEQAYYIPLYYSASKMATKDDVDGINWDPIGMYDFSYIRVPVK
ncbi:MAG: ABC transporter substrate-binding protein [Lachnospiraceae bacterium]|nr:ABC transporter substrate-binding protein [Lachnospiraceae bacterium]